MDEHEKKMHGEKKSETVTVKVPSFMKSFRKNPWILATLVLAIVVVAMFFMGGAVVGKSVSKDTASQLLLDYLNQGAPGQFVLESIESEYGLYKVNVIYQGQVVPIYVTKDGTMAGSFQPISAAGSTNEPVDVSEDDDAVEGDVNAPVTIIEFSDYECPFCGKFYEETLPLIREEYVETGKVKIVFRDFPLNFHPLAQPSAEAAECVRDVAGSDEVYFEYHDKLFSNQADLSEENLVIWADEMGYDIQECLDSGTFTAEVQKDLSDGQSAGVSGTPGFFINGRLIEGAQPYANFKAAIDQALEEVA